MGMLHQKWLKRKKYLKKEELESLELIVFAFLDLAENRAKKNFQ